MMIYKLSKRTATDNATGEKSVTWYARNSYLGGTVSLTQLAAHMADHNSPYSEGVIKGVLTDMVSCIRELVLEGKSVKLDNLAIFSASLNSKGVEDPATFDAKSDITGAHLLARATGHFTASEVKKDLQLKRLGEYSEKND